MCTDIVGKKILLIGNGFDLAHGLPTKYTDFLKFVEVINQVIEIKNNDDISNLDWRGINQQIKELIKINMGNVRNNIFSQLFIVPDYILKAKLFI